jgi:hypothetical protein
MEKGKRDREHRDTGRQRSEPEEGRKGAVAAGSEAQLVSGDAMLGGG